jgi:hypothetical protein
VRRNPERHTAASATSEALERIAQIREFNDSGHRIGLEHVLA